MRQNGIKAGFYRIRLIWIILLCIATNLFHASAQSPSVTRILFLLDGSSSMAEAWGGSTKIESARSTISRMADSLGLMRNVQLALRVYGHQSLSSDNNCLDTKLEVPFASRNGLQLKTALSQVRPKGITPIAYSLEQAANDFPADPRARSVIILVTDGVESCTGDPCAISLKIQEKKISLRPFVIGLSMNADATRAMECIGYFQNARDPESLYAIFQSVVDRILTSAAIQVNLLDAAGNAVETDANITFYDDSDDRMKYNFYHTLTHRGLPDTMVLDPVPVYRITVHTNPAIQRSGIQPHSNRLDTVNIPAAQGYLKIALEGKAINNNLNEKIRVLVRENLTRQQVSVQHLDETVKYLVGNYDLEILTLPRLVLKNIEVKQSNTTTVTIPLPGMLSLSKSSAGTGALMMKDGSRWVKIYQLNETLSGELIGLQPGEYTVIFRSKFARKSDETVQRNVTIRSGETAAIRF